MTLVECIIIETHKKQKNTKIARKILANIFTKLYVYMETQYYNNFKTG